MNCSRGPVDEDVGRGGGDYDDCCVRIDYDDGEMEVVVVAQNLLLLLRRHGNDNFDYY